MLVIFKNKILVSCRTCQFGMSCASRCAGKKKRFSDSHIFSRVASPLLLLLFCQWHSNRILCKFCISLRCCNELLVNYGITWSGSVHPRNLRKILEHCQYFSGLSCGAAAKWIGWQPGQRQDLGFDLHRYV